MKRFMRGLLFTIGVLIAGIMRIIGEIIINIEAIIFCVIITFLSLFIKDGKISGTRLERVLLSLNNFFIDIMSFMDQISTLGMVDRDTAREHFSNTVCNLINGIIYGIWV